MPVIAASSRAAGNLPIRLCIRPDSQPVFSDPNSPAAEKKVTSTHPAPDYHNLSYGTMHTQYMAAWVPSFLLALQNEVTASQLPPFTSFQLATNGSDGYPHSRTVVYRGFLFNDKTTNVLCCTTDKRMNKYRELMADDRVEAVFYFPTLKKQFRIRAKARIIDDDHWPQIDLVEPVLSDGNYSDDDDEDSLEFSPRANGGSQVQRQPVRANIVSPSQLALAKPAVGDSSSTTLSQLNWMAPHQQEFQDERLRQWDQLSKLLKRLFRRPEPLADMTEERTLAIDAISRGVDGKKEDYGLANFAVLALFPERVDFVDLESDKRYIYDYNGKHATWREREVCP